MEEVEEVVEARQRILTEEDAKLAHYASIGLMGEMGKKTPKPAKLRRIPDEPPEIDEKREQASVTSLDTRRKRNALRSAFAATRQKSG